MSVYQRDEMQRERYAPGYFVKAVNLTYGRTSWTAHCDIYRGVGGGGEDDHSSFSQQANIESIDQLLKRRLFWPGYRNSGQGGKYEYMHDTW